jgi:ectoine hydroxylase-related dioxygenase (phytanoyl-CoA dioxygenase family)
MQESIKTFGVREFSQPATAVEKRVEEIKLLGYTLLPGVIAESELPSIRKKIDDIYLRQTEEIGGEDSLKRIGDTYTARCLLAYDEYFLSVATNADVLSIVASLLGDYYTLMLQNGVINVPKVGDEQNAGSWHRDLNYQHFISTRPISVSALFCIDDFSAETGGTYLLPASHKTEAFPSEEFVSKHEMVVNAKAGSAIVFDSMLYHRGGHNRSANIRRAINHMYTLPLVKQQISLPKMLRGKFQDDPFLNRFLGYESESDEGVIEFRQKRLGRIQNSK